MYFRHSLDSILKPLFENVINEEMQVIPIRRRHLWADALRSFTKTSFLVNTLLNVNFIGEEGADSGGPRREFLQLLMKKLIKESGVLTGNERRMTFTSNPLFIMKEVGPWFKVPITCYL